jgi:hypothetical protein
LAVNVKGAPQSIQAMVLSVYIRTPEKVSDTGSESRGEIAGAAPRGTAAAALERGKPSPAPGLQEATVGPFPRWGPGGLEIRANLLDKPFGHDLTAGEDIGESFRELSLALLMNEKQELPQKQEKN